MNVKPQQTKHWVLSDDEVARYTTKLQEVLQMLVFADKSYNT